MPLLIILWHNGENHVYKISYTMEYIAGQEYELTPEEAQILNNLGYVFKRESEKNRGDKTRIYHCIGKW